MNRLTKYILGLVLLFLFVGVDAKEVPKKYKRKTNKHVSSFRDQCEKAKGQTKLEINNVRATLLTGGDLWWDGNGLGQYIVPKPKVGSDAPEISAIFAGGVWIGGRDSGENLKVAASTFPSGSSVDYSPGPLVSLGEEAGTTEKAVCEDWDRFFKVTADEIDLHLLNFGKGDYECSTIPDGVKYWPAKGNPFFSEKYDFALPNTDVGLAGFFDFTESGEYDPCGGDYPIIEIRGCPDPVYADEMVFWIYNDNGNVHTESFGDAIQMEVQVQAFGFVSNDEINDMTFYRYKLINRATDNIKETYFAMWIDPDLGCHEDDYIGCDTTKVSRKNRQTGEIEFVSRDLMILYNEDEVDGHPGKSCSGGAPTYESDVPILGVDYFRGPLIPHSFKEVNGETVLVRTKIGETADTLLEGGMSSFMYYNNRGSGNNPEPTTDPGNAEEYYNYITGRWKDGRPLTIGGTGYNIGSMDSTKYAFPGAPDDASGWSMCGEDAPSGDRRTLQVTGPLLLEPGAKNELIIGVVWVPHINYPCPSLDNLIFADGLAQALFDHCFDRLEGPDAPDMYGIELDKELILVLSNDTTELNNNAFEEYEEVDIFSENVAGDSLYRFEGYKIFQLADENVSVQELDDIERAILIKQVDVKNDIDVLYNWTTISNPNQASQIWFPTEVVDGEDEGLRHSFQILTDAFAKGDNRLVNHKKYHYLVLAYGYNNYADFDPNHPQDGQRRPYLEGVKNISTLTLIPRPIVYENLNTVYGDGPEITRISGRGVGSNTVDMKDEMYELIINEAHEGEVHYKRGAGPINIKVFDPLHVQDGNYRLEIFGDFDSAKKVCGFTENTTSWVLTNLSTSEEFYSEQSLDKFNEQIFSDVGISISIGQVAKVGEEPLVDENNGTLGSEIVYADPNGQQWFSGIHDADFGVFDYLVYDEFGGNVNQQLDPNQAMANIGEGFFTPFYMTNIDPPPSSNFWLATGSSAKSAIKNSTGLYHLNNVDIVMTSDKSKWSRCAVVERWDDRYSFSGNTRVGLGVQFGLRDQKSVDQNGNVDGTGTKGMGYFPGYAIDVETGQRLNVFFGENSVYNSSNLNYETELLDGIPLGEDMIFNPSSQMIIDADPLSFSMYNVIAGGQHIIYVTREPYDGCEKIAGKLAKLNQPVSIGHALSLITWQAIPVLPEGMKMNSIAEGLIPNDVTIKMRVVSPYNRERIVEIGKTTCNSVDENPVYEFQLDGLQSTPVAEADYESALANVNVVPNPYYGYSAYEFTQYATTVKITNVPAKATVTIYSLDGKFIKQFKRDERPLIYDPADNPGIVSRQIYPDIEWNLQNSKGVPVSSGIYLIHIDAPELQASRTIKWFGVNRKFDPSGL